MSLSASEIFKEAKERAYYSLSFKDIERYENLHSCVVFFKLVAFFLIISFIFFLLKFNTFNTFISLFSCIICSLLLFIIACIYAIKSPDKSFYPSIHEEIKQNVKKIRKEIQQSNSDITNLSEAMSYWDSLTKYKDNIQVSNLTDKFSECLVEDINHQDSAGNTILHYMLKEDPQSPFIAKALLLNADVYLTNHEGVSVYSLLQEHMPEYLVFIEKNKLINQISARAGSPPARL